METFVNISEFNKFLEKQFNGSLTKASKETAISKSTLCLIKKGSRDIGTSTFCKLNRYCSKNNINISNMFFLS